MPAEVYGQWKSRERQKSDESIDVASEAARSAIQKAQQAQPGLTRPHGRLPRSEQEATVLRDAVSELGRIKQFAVEIPATGVSKRWQGSSA